MTAGFKKTLLPIGKAFILYFDMAQNTRVSEYKMDSVHVI